MTECVSGASGRNPQDLAVSLNANGSRVRLGAADRSSRGGLAGTCAIALGGGASGAPERFVEHTMSRTINSSTSDRVRFAAARMSDRTNILKIASQWDCMDLNTAADLSSDIASFLVLISLPMASMIDRAATVCLTFPDLDDSAEGLVAIPAIPELCRLAQGSLGIGAAFRSRDQLQRNIPPRAVFDSRWAKAVLRGRPCGQGSRRLRSLGWLPTLGLDLEV